MNTFNGTLDIYLASAGSGKTHQLMEIIDSYVQQGVPLDRIAFVTFTKKGAEVAQNRMMERYQVGINNLKNFRTIHSMTFRGVKAGRDMMMDFTKYKDFGNKAGYNFGYIGLNYAEGINFYEMKDLQLIAMEQLYRNNRPYFDKIAEDKVDNEELVRFMKLYTKYKDTFHYYDFTDLLDLYLKNGIVEDVDVVCLDEMQDSSLLQWQVVFQAFSKAQHIYVCADIKQCIFSYAGASPETVLKLRGNVHMMDKSYRVPSTILDFAQHQIVDEMELSDHSDCKAVHEGGELKYLTSLDELDSYYRKDKTYFFLARNKRFFDTYIDWCKQHAVPYRIRGVPIFTVSDQLEFREGRTDTWDTDKLQFARDCYRAGTFYGEPNIDISTIHTVKGDEADVVVLMSDISRAVESQLDIDPDSEHRVFYVGVTRAKEKLLIVEPQTKRYYPYIIV